MSTDIKESIITVPESWYKSCEVVRDKTGKIIPRDPTLPTAQIAELTPHQMLSTLVTQGANPSVLEKFMDLAGRWEAKEAKKSYVLAMAKFKKEGIEILKTKHVKYKNKNGSYTEYSYAELDKILETVSPVLSKHGFFQNWKTAQEPGFVTVTCVITHKDGHSEHTPMRGPEDHSGGKNAIQAVGSTTFYLERYTFLAITGLAAKNQDDDGRTSEAVEELISEQQANTIHSKLKENGLDEKKFLKFINQASIATIPVKSFDYCIREINATIKKRETKTKVSEK